MIPYMDRSEIFASPGGVRMWVLLVWASILVAGAWAKQTDKCKACIHVAENVESKIYADKHQYNLQYGHRVKPDGIRSQ